MLRKLAQIASPLSSRPIGLISPYDQPVNPRAFLRTNAKTMAFQVQLRAPTVSTALLLLESATRLATRRRRWRAALARCRVSTKPGMAERRTCEGAADRQDQPEAERVEPYGLQSRPRSLGQVGEG